MQETSFQILALTDLCTAHLLQGDVDAALEASRRATDLFAARESRSLGAGSRPRTYGGGTTGRWPRTARPRKRTGAANRLRAAAGRHRHAERRGPAPQLSQQDRHAPRDRPGVDRARARRRFSAKRRAAHLAGEADLRAPFERLVDTGMRLNELRSAAELHEFLVDEVTELSGAERVLLVLDRQRAAVVGSLLPTGEDAAALLRRSRRRSTRRAERARRACATYPKAPTSSTSVPSSSRR